jgi:glycosyltransferase involved in cell wall biosynthesis
MKKLAFFGFLSLSDGGMQKITAMLANELCDTFEVHLLSVHENGGAYSNYVKINSKIIVGDLGFANLRLRKIFFNVRKKLKNYIKKNGIDILIVNGITPIPLVVSIIHKIKNLKVLLWDHEGFDGRGFKDKLICHTACVFFDRIITITKRSLNDYIKFFNVKKEKIKCIYNFYDKNFENNFDYDSKKIISAARFVPEKGFDLAVRTAIKVFSKHVDWQWHIFGNGPEFNNIEDKISEFELEKNVILRGCCSDVFNTKYAVFVLNSLREGFSLALLEAKMHGIPSVAFDCIAGPNEIIQEGVNGFLIKCYDTDLMAEKINYLIENPEKIREFSKNCNLENEKFKKDEIIKKWVKISES